MDRGPITQVLQQVREGDGEAAQRLLPLVYEQLRRLARAYLRSERTGHTLQATALVHEAYLRLVGEQAPDWHDREHFFAAAAQLMRRILVDYARARAAAKRGGSRVRISLEEAIDLRDEPDEVVVALDAALTDLAILDPELARLVELRFFAGLTFDETAALLQVSPRTVKRRWNVAKGWLYWRVRKGGCGDAGALGAAQATD